MSKSAENAASLRADIQSLRDDLNNLKTMIAKVVARASSESVDKGRAVISDVASQAVDSASSVAEKGSELTTAASKQARTFVSELLTLGENNQLAAITAAMALGVLIGLIAQGRT